MNSQTANRRHRIALLGCLWKWGAYALLTATWFPLQATATEAELAASSSSPEDSVLIASRESLEEAYETPEGSLEPISQVSEFEPSPAKPPSEADTKPVDSEPTGQGVVEVSDQETPEVAPVRVAKNEPATATKYAPGDLAAGFLQEEQQVAAAPFRGIIAGKSTRQQLLSAWGQPEKTRDIAGGKIYTYNQDRFETIEVKVEEGRVETIKAQLDQQSTPDRLAAKLRVDRIDSVTIKEESTGADLAVVYPEKGLTMLLGTVGKQALAAPRFVTHLVLQAPDAEVFALRAQSRPEHAYSQRLSDLRQAIAIEADNDYVLWLRSGVYLATGQPVKAEQDAAAALKQQPENSSYRLRWCEALAGIGRYDEAVLETRKVIDAEGTAPLVKAQALALMGHMASLGDAQIAEKAIGFHTTAIGIADKLASSQDDAERRAAKRLLIDSHLAVAVEVSRRSYDDKGEVVAQWIGRASGLTEEYLAKENGSLAMRVVVARRALEALANFKPGKDPGPWVTEAGDAASAVVESSDDPLLKNATHWELGQSLLHAMRVAHSRREADRAIGYGEKAIDHLAKGAESGDLRHEAELLVGRLYFHLGAAYAVHKNDHAAAVEWYDRAEPLLTSDAPESELIVPRQRGEALVSMGVSYWDQDQQTKAMELTVAGAKVMQQGVSAKVLDRAALAVPYGNLATMHLRRGDEQLAAKYTSLATEAKQTAASKSQVAKRTQTQSRRQAAVSQDYYVPSARTANQRSNQSQQRRTGRSAVR